jgi:LasA protease
VRRIVMLLIVVGSLAVACHRRTAPLATPEDSVGGALILPTQEQPDTSLSQAVAEAVNTPLIPQEFDPAATPRPSPTPYASAMPLPTPPPQLVETYIVQPGDTLSGISYAFDVSLVDLVELNELESEEAIIHVGQSLLIPLTVTRTAPAITLLPDSEVVFSPAYVGFEVEGFVERYGGYLSRFTSPVNGEHVLGTAIVSQVARQYSVGPRLLLAVLEHFGGWVTQDQPWSYQALGATNPYYEQGFLLQLSWVANQLNDGYYTYKRDGQITVMFSDMTRALIPAGVNAGTAAVLNLLALDSDYDGWQVEAEAFIDTYRQLFGEPASLTFAPLVPENLTQPALTLPWEKGNTFYYTGGPHAAYGSRSAWAAVDFGPPDIKGSCYYSAQNIVASASGRLLMGEVGEMYLDLDGDGNLQTGWVLLYLHTVARDDVSEGQYLEAGSPLGYASCEGGIGTSSHLHFARRYNGEWMPADGPVSFVLSGWQFQNGSGQYEGTAVRNGTIKTACECWDDVGNGLVGE